MASNGLTRRHLFGRAALAAGGTVLAAPAIQTVAEATEPAGRGLVEVTLTVNGERTRMHIDPRLTLLDTLRERMNLTGTKKGCDRGQCGACTVHVDGRRVVSCLTLTASVDGKEITTIEGLAPPGGELNPVQQAFIEQDGYQCGFCTSGQIMSAVAVLREGRARTDEEVREAMSGNICRCGAYSHIVEAIRQARERGRVI
ncbi:MAG TPA: (2Fe-2S)-binding protein [Actinophytocola sp.]|uniref:(2Fe-2S)-binding protein n=1 Tax=Actinophytocola sp. TaxID=1872138 RepID=UPI002DDD3AC1|nr:(2Fe-2S)-binding protein [Actinophytocola sp.]HEV2782236.1 (2Fe-2S)-binding protein [Actinophytocola sp.]